MQEHIRRLRTEALQALTITDVRHALTRVAPHAAGIVQRVTELEGAGEKRA